MLTELARAGVTVQHINELRRLCAYKVAIPILLHRLQWVEDRRVKGAIAGG